VKPNERGYLGEQMWWRGDRVVSMQDPVFERFEDAASEDAGWEHLGGLRDYAEESKDPGR
jgi:hypothetical protein